MLPGRATAAPVRHRSTIKPRTANNINLTQIVNSMPPIERTTNIREKQRLVKGIPKNDIISASKHNMALLSPMSTIQKNQTPLHATGMPNQKFARDFDFQDDNSKLALSVVSNFSYAPNSKRDTKTSHF